MTLFLRSWLLLFLVLAAPAMAAIEGELSDESTGEVVETPPEVPLEFEDKLMRDTPRHSLEGFLQATDDDDYELASEFLDMRNLRGRAAELAPDVLALGFEIVLERGLWVDLDTLSEDTEGIGNDEDAGSLIIRNHSCSIFIATFFAWRFFRKN